MLNLEQFDLTTQRLQVEAVELLRASLDALVNCGITIAAKMPKMITTIKISTRVNPRALRFIVSPQRVKLFTFHKTNRVLGG